MHIGLGFVSRNQVADSLQKFTLHAEGLPRALVSTLAGGKLVQSAKEALRARKEEEKMLQEIGETLAALEAIKAAANEAVLGEDWGRHEAIFAAISNFINSLPLRGQCPQLRQTLRASVADIVAAAEKAWSAAVVDGGAAVDAADARVFLQKLEAIHGTFADDSVATALSSAKSARQVEKLRWRVPWRRVAGPFGLARIARPCVQVLHFGADGVCLEHKRGATARWPFQDANRLAEVAEGHRNHEDARQRCQPDPRSVWRVLQLGRPGQRVWIPVARRGCGDGPGAPG